MVRMVRMVRIGNVASAAGGVDSVRTRGRDPGKCMLAGRRHRSLHCDCAALFLQTLASLQTLPCVCACVMCMCVYMLECVDMCMCLCVLVCEPLVPSGVCRRYHEPAGIVQQWALTPYRPVPTWSAPLELSGALCRVCVGSRIWLSFKSTTGHFAANKPLRWADCNQAIDS